MIFVNELIKAFCKRTTIAIFAVLLLLNGVMLYINEAKQSLEYTPEQYKSAYQTLEGLDTHAAFERISQFHILHTDLATCQGRYNLYTNLTAVT